MKITKSQLKQIIKEEVLKILNEGPRIRSRPAITGAEAVASAILQPHPASLRKIVAATGTRSGSGRHMEIYNLVYKEIEEYIKNDCAQNIMKIAENAQSTLSEEHK